MRNILLIAQREAHSLFATPTAWGLASFFQLLGGLLFCRMIVTAQYAELASFHGMLAGLLVLLFPILTMQRFSGERRAGTLELLLTSPISAWELVLGKWLAVAGFAGLIAGLSLQYPLVLTAYAHPAAGQWWPATLAVFLLGALLGAIGLCTSAWSENSVLAGMVSLALSLFLWWFHSLGSILGAEEFTLWNALSLYTRIASMTRGVLDTRDVFYFAAMTLFFLSLAARGVESDRW